MMTSTTPMTETASAVPAPTATQRPVVLVDPESVSILPEFRARQGQYDTSHVRTLAKVARGGQPLHPILLWNDPDTGSNSLILLDGAYRLSAYETAKWPGLVPARIFECSRSDAFLMAAGANSKDRKPLSPKEKQDFAWRFVRDPEVTASRTKLARATGVSESTISRMRRRWAALRERPNFAATGHWFRDQEDRDTDYAGSTDLEGAARETAVQEYIGKLRDLLDWRKGHPLMRDEQARFEVISRALGHPADEALAEFILGGTDEADYWMTGEVKAVGDYSHLTKIDDEDDDENPDF